MTNCRTLWLAAMTLRFAGWPLLAQTPDGALNPASSAPSVASPQQLETVASPDTEAGEQYKLVNNVKLVLVPVLVTDRAGRHIAGLKASDFAIKDNGKLHQVKFAQEITTPDHQQLERVKLPPGTYSNHVQEAKAPLRVVIILFDMLNSHFKDQVPARQQLAKYLQEQADPGTMVALLGLGRGGLRMYHDMTSDTKGLALELQMSMATGRHSILTNLAPETSDTESEAAFVGHGEFARTGSSGRSSKRLIILDTLAAFRNIAGAYSNIPGRKSLVWVTGGFPFTIAGSKAGSSGIAEMDEDGLDDILPDYQKTWQALNDANVALYPVDMHGLVNTAIPPASYKTRSGGSGTGGGRSGSRRGGRSGGGEERGGSVAQQLGRYQNEKQNRLEDNLATFQTFALETGGKAFYNNNDLAAGFRQAVDDSKSSYMLGYSLEENAQPGWHALHVDVALRGASVRARTGFLVPKNDATRPEKFDAQQSDVQLAMSSPMNFTGIPMTVKWLDDDKPGVAPVDGKLPEGSKHAVKFRITVPPHVVQVDDRRQPSRISLDFVGLARTQGAADAADFAKKIEGPLKPDAARRLDHAGIQFESFLALEPGDYNVRFVVRDNVGGRLGSVTAPVNVK